MAYEVPAGARFAYASSLRSLDEQLRRIEALDTKAGILLAADGVLAGFLFSRGSTTRNYTTAPRAEAIARRASAPQAWLEWRSVPNVLRAINANALNLARKARLIGLSVLSLLVGVLTTGAYLTYTILTD